MSGRLSGRTAVVTGGASGLGRAIALRFADEGAFVVVGDVRPDPREGGEPAGELLGDRGLFLDADASRWEDLDRLVSAAVERGGRLDVMVNNAGISGRYSKPLLETEEEDWDAIMAVNLRGVFLGCKRAVAQMLEQEPVGEVRGRVINISSQHGMIGPPGHVAYAASKGGVVNLTRDLASQWARRGVRVNAIAPGWFESEMTAPLFEGEERWKRYLERTVPLGRAGREGELDGALLFLAGDASVYVTGQTVVVDGGWSAV